MKSNSRVFLLHSYEFIHIKQYEMFIVYADGFGFDAGMTFDCFYNLFVAHFNMSTYNVEGGWGVLALLFLFLGWSAHQGIEKLIQWDLTI